MLALSPLFPFPVRTETQDASPVLLFALRLQLLSLTPKKQGICTALSFRHSWDFSSASGLHGRTLLRRLLRLFPRMISGASHLGEASIGQSWLDSFLGDSESLLRSDITSLEKCKSYQLKEPWTQDRPQSRVPPFPRSGFDTWSPWKEPGTS